MHTAGRDTQQVGEQSEKKNTLLRPLVIGGLSNMYPFLAAIGAESLHDETLKLSAGTSVSQSAIFDPFTYNPLRPE